MKRTKKKTKQPKVDIKKVADGETLRKYRELMGMTQKDFANLLKTDVGNYHKMEKGIRNSGDRVARVKRLFVKWKDAEIIRLKERIAILKTMQP